MKKKILIVDDEPDMLAILQIRLESAGYEVFTAEDGEAGLAQVTKVKPDLVILDVMMPKLNGYQVCQNLKQAQATKGIPVILLTAKAEESDKFLGKACGADAYITKEYESDKLLEKMRELII
ncbi:MAG: response regulator [Deltaproteobacteria bacterium]|nr:response regulator [Deltaproteobacteria bacterium]